MVGQRRPQIAIEAMFDPCCAIHLALKCTYAVWCLFLFFFFLCLIGSLFGTLGDDAWHSFEASFVY